MTSSNDPKPATTALITGGSMGIGLELAREFAAHGHNLILVARHQDKLDAIAGALEGKFSVSVAAISADLADAESPQRLFDAVRGDGHQVGFLVNNAGFGLGGEFSETDLARELEMIQVNVAALTHLTKLFLAPMLHRRSGAILNVASTAAFQPGPLMSVYYASKAYVLSFSEAIAEELRDSGVTVTALCPGTTATQFAETAGVSNSGLYAKTGIGRADDVARYGYAAMMRGERVAIPALRDRIMLQAERLAPRALVTRMVRYAQENR